MNTSTLFCITIMVIILTVLGIFASTDAISIRFSHEIGLYVLMNLFVVIDDEDFMVGGARDKRHH